MTKSHHFALAMALIVGSGARAASDNGYIRAAAANEHVIDVRVNLEDKRIVHLEASFLVTDPDRTVHLLKVSGDLSLKFTTGHSAPTNPLIGVGLVRTIAGISTTLVGQNTQGGGAQTTAMNFSVCGDRIILVNGGTDTGRCADLPPMAKHDPILGGCGVACLGPYEGMPTRITSHARIAPPSEPGEPLIISGRVIDAYGQPRAGIIVYAYHTNRLGIYPPPTPPRSIASEGNGTLRGWAMTDSEGRYAFETIGPGNYPNQINPAHVHMHIIEPGCATYAISELQFADDPMRKKLSASDLKDLEELVVVETPSRTPHGWEVTRNIRLGENVSGYKPCSRDP